MDVTSSPNEVYWSGCVVIALRGSRVRTICKAYRFIPARISIAAIDTWYDTFLQTPAQTVETQEAVLTLTVLAGLKIFVAVEHRINPDGPNDQDQYATITDDDEPVCPSHRSAGAERHSAPDVPYIFGHGLPLIDRFGDGAR